MILRSQFGELRRQLLCSLYKRTVAIDRSGPIVSFCFDDFPRTAYSVGGRILSSYGARGTYYAAPGLIGSHNELGEQLTRSDIDSVLADGHELGCHTYSHCSLRRVSLDDFEADVVKGRDVLQRMTSSNLNTFAYPYGHASIRSKKRLASHLGSCRGIDGGLIWPAADLNLLRANSLYGDADQLCHAISLLDQCEQQHSWLIFYTHDVRDNPSPFGCTPALLEQVVALTVAKGIRISPVGAVVAESAMHAPA